MSKASTEDQTVAISIHKEIQKMAPDTGKDITPMVEMLMALTAKVMTHRDITKTDMTKTDMTKTDMTKTV